MSKRENPYENSQIPEMHNQEFDELMIAELDDRLEFSAAVMEANLACNGTGCTQNGSCGKKGS